MLIGALLALSGCAGSSLSQIPEHGDMVRCTQYSGNTATPFGTSLRADGCQCVKVGEMQATVKMEFDSCVITLSP